MYDESDDAELEEALRRAAGRFDPVPPELVRQAVEGFGWRTIDADLAELTFDSLAEADADAHAALRGPAQPRWLAFRSGEVDLEIELTWSRQGYRLVGQLSPARQATVQIRHRAGTVDVAADDLGRFSSAAVPAGPLRLRCLPAGASRAVATDWITV